MSIPILLLSIILFFVLFFGIGFLLNMLLRMTWIMAIIYPVVFIFLIDKVGTSEYFSHPAQAFAKLGTTISALGVADIVICMAGFGGAVLSGFGIKLLRKSGYQMF